MIYIRNTFLLLILLTLPVNRLSAASPPDVDLKALMLSNWDKIEDYEVDIKLAMNIPGFRMPSRNIHYLYKAPDKSKVEVKGFAIVPKQGIQPFFTFLRDSLEFQIVTERVVNGKSVFEVALEDTFMNEPGKISFYVEQGTGNVLEAWVIHNDQEFFRLKSEYAEQDGIQLPVSTQIQMTFPPDFKNLQRLGKKPTELKGFQSTMTDEWLQGTVSIKFKNYKLNKGIPDYRFEDEATDKIQD